MKTYRFADLSFPYPPLILAPMEDVTDPPFRLICHEMGADWVYSEFIASEGLIRNVSKSMHKLDIWENERPVSIQIFGANIDSMVEAARITESANPDFIDINFGCPVKKIALKGGGAGLLNDAPKMAKMASEVVKAVKTPVTVKTRLGWDQNTKNIVDTAERLQDTGIAALAIHGRTRCQLYRGEADWTLIGEVKNNPRMKIPIIGNGDIKDGYSAKYAIDNFGIDGIMIGRACIGNPWVFKEIKKYLQTGEDISQPNFDERKKTCLKHLEMSVKWKGEKTAIFEMRKHYSNYFKGIRDFKQVRMELVLANTFDEIYTILSKV